MHGAGHKGRLPPVVDLAFVSRVSHYGDGSKRAGAGGSKNAFRLRVVRHGESVRRRIG